jgi:hypothetical protein
MQELQDLQVSSAVIALPTEVQSQVTDPLQPLKAQRRWVVYRSVEDKAPLQPSGYPAKSDTRSTWSTYDDCMSAVATGKFHGVGFVLTKSEYVGIDFDDVRNEGGMIDPVALSVAKSLDSYSEVSPSGTGFHTLVHAPSFSGGKKKTYIEIYGGDSSKYFTVTGQHINGTPNVVNGRESEIAAVFSTLDAINTQITSSVKAQKKSLVSKVDSNKLADLMGGNWEPHYDGVSEAVLGLLCLLAEKTKGNPEAMDEEFRKSGLYADHSPEHANWIEKWERRGKEEIATAIKFNISPSSSSNDPFGLGAFTRPAVTLKTAFDFILAPLDGKPDGWFPRSDTSLIAGSSGSAKTTEMFDILEKQRKGVPVHGHKTHGLPFIVCMADRGEFANERTLSRMKIDPKTFPLRHIKATALKTVLKEIKDTIEAEPIFPAVVFVEGADMLLEDASKMNLVAPFLNALNSIARHYHIAFILSVGAPKKSPKDKYASKRDTIYGSVAWGRMTETVIIMSTPNDDDTSKYRDMAVLPRQQNSETFSLVFNDKGTLDEVPPVILTVPDTPLNLWVFNRAGWFTVADAVKGTQLHRNTVSKDLNDMVDKFLEKQKSGTKNEHAYRVRLDISVAFGGQS